MKSTRRKLLKKIKSKNQKLLRQRWHQATSRLVTNDQLREMIGFSSVQLIEQIEKESLNG